jgi:hypothetical protein
MQVMTVVVAATEKLPTSSNASDDVLSSVGLKTVIPAQAGIQCRCFTEGQ